MNVQGRVRELIEARDDDTLLVRGHALRAPGEARAWAHRLTETVTTRLLERRPHLTEHAWHSFTTMLDDVVRGAQAPSDRLEGEILTLIDGL
jgi:hypothetical protein